MIGIVKWYNVKKGYGFILPPTDGADVFVHVSAVKAAGEQEIREGQRVEYDLIQDRNGRLCAGNLRIEHKEKKHG